MERLREVGIEEKNNFEIRSVIVGNTNDNNGVRVFNDVTQNDDAKTTNTKKTDSEDGSRVKATENKPEKKEKKISFKKK